MKRTNINIITIFLFGYLIALSICAQLTTNVIDDFELISSWQFNSYPKGVSQFAISATNTTHSYNCALKLEFTVSSFADFDFGPDYNTQKTTENILIPGVFRSGENTYVGVWVEGSESGPDNSEKLQFEFTDINNKKYTITAINEDNGHTAFHTDDAGWHFWRVNPADTISSTLFPIRLISLNINGWDRGESSRYRCLVIDDLTVISYQTNCPEFTFETIYPPICSPSNFEVRVRVGNFSGQIITGELNYAFYTKGNKIIPGEDFANEKNASSSSTNDQYHGPAGVVIEGANPWDSRHYSNYSDQPESGEWWQIDFGKVKSIGWLALKPTPHGATVDVYASESGTSWRPVLTNLVLNDWETYTYRIDKPISGRYVRVKFSRAPMTKNGEFFVGMVYFGTAEAIELPNGNYAPEWSDTVLNYGKSNIEIKEGVSLINLITNFVPPVCLGVGQLCFKIKQDIATADFEETFFFTCLHKLKTGITNTFFGCNSGFFDDINFIGKTGARSERQWFNWSMFVETNGAIDLDNYELSDVYNFAKWPWYKNILENSLNSGIENVGVINKTPEIFSVYPNDGTEPYAEAYPSCDLARDDDGDGHIDYTNTHFYRFAYGLAGYFSNLISDWEICNEYNLFTGNSWDSWRGTIGGVGYDYSVEPATQIVLNSSSMTLEQRGKDYMEQLRAGYMAIKAVNPKAGVTMMGLAGLDSWLIKKMMEYEYDDGKHGYEFTDGFNFHAYFADEKPEISDFNGNTSGGRLEKPFIEILDEFLEWTQTNYPAYPTRLTEFGWDNKFGQWKPEGKSLPVSLDDQAAYLSRFFLIGKSRNLEKMHWFTAEDLWGSFFFAGMGLLDLDSLPKKSALAMNTTVAEIGDARFLKYAETNNSNIWSMVFENTPEDRIQTVWSVSGTVSNFEIDVSDILENLDFNYDEITVRVEYLYNKYSTNFYVNNSKITLNITEAPCFIRPIIDIPEPLWYNALYLMFLFFYIKKIRVRK